MGTFALPRGGEGLLVRADHELIEPEKNMMVILVNIRLSITYKSFNWIIRQGYFFLAHINPSGHSPQRYMVSTSYHREINFVLNLFFQVNFFLPKGEIIY